MSPGTEKRILRISEDIENISPWEDGQTALEFVFQLPFKNTGILDF